MKCTYCLETLILCSYGDNIKFRSTCITHLDDSWDKEKNYRWCEKHSSHGELYHS